LIDIYAKKLARKSFFLAAMSFALAGQQPPSLAILVAKKKTVMVAR